MLPSINLTDSLAQ